MESLSAHNPVINACEYAKWIRQYNFSMVAENSRPDSINKGFKDYFTIASDYIRAIHY